MPRPARAGLAIVLLTPQKVNTPTSPLASKSMASWRDYFQLMKVRIAGLLLLVALAGYVATSGPAVDGVRLGGLLVAGFLASTGSSVVNSYVDRDIDPLMDRTRRRALPMGRIDPPQKVLGFGGVLIA